MIGAFLGLIFLFKNYAVAGISIPLALFVSGLELLVCFLQAYVFALLTCIYLNDALHPGH